MSCVVLVLYVLLVFSQLALTEMCKTIMLVMLAEVQTDLLTLYAHTHRDELVDEPIAEVAHREGVDEDNDNCEEVIEEDHEAVPCS